MKRRLIGKGVGFGFTKWCRGKRCWVVNGQWHRDDGGPAYEETSSGYCSWYEHGMLVRHNQ